MISNRYNPGTCCDVDYACLKFTGRPQASRTAVDSTSQPVLFQFMCRWTCSRCWKTAMMLGQMGSLLMDHNIAVVLVGDSHYLQPATRLAAELKLPVTLLGDEARALKHAYGFCLSKSSDHGQDLLLLDEHGKPLFCQDNFKNRHKLDLSRLISAIKTLPRKEPDNPRKLAC